MHDIEICIIAKILNVKKTVMHTKINGLIIECFLGDFFNTIFSSSKSQN